MLDTNSCPSQSGRCKCSFHLRPARRASRLQLASKGMLSFGCSVFVIASATSIAFAKQTFFNKVFVADRQKDEGSWRTSPETTWGLERPWQGLEQPPKRGGSRPGGNSYPFRIRLSEERNVNSQQKRGISLPPGSLPVLEKGEERCNLIISLLHSIICQHFSCLFFCLFCL